VKRTRTRFQWLRDVAGLTLVASTLWLGACDPGPEPGSESGSSGLTYTCYDRTRAIAEAAADVAQETIRDGHQHEWYTIVVEAYAGCWMYVEVSMGGNGHVSNEALWPRFVELDSGTKGVGAIVHSHNNPGSYQPGLSNGDRGAQDLYGVNIIAVEPGRTEGDMSSVHIRDAETKQEKTGRAFGSQFDEKIFQ
jgi:hypothetical protein